MIHIDKICDNFFVWKAEDVYKLRKVYRIYGKLGGCFPRRPFQNQCFSLPLQLLPAEAKLLIDKGYAKLVQMKQFSDEENKKNMKEYSEFKKDSFDEQRKVFREERLREIELMADKILNGKRKKMAKLKSASSENEEVGSGENKQLTREAVIEDETRKIILAPDEICMVQLFTACPWKDADEECMWNYPSTSREKLQYATFRDLWEKGYYLTSGSKFGGDFLAYAGYPVLYHSLYIVICVQYKQELPVSRIPLYGQLGTRVKKTVILATVKPCGSVDYLSITWCGKWKKRLSTQESDTDSSEAELDCT